MQLALRICGCPAPKILESGLPFQAEREGEPLSLLREGHHVSQFSGLLLGLSLYFYHVRELLVCWLIFTLLFVCLALVILGGVLAVHVGEYLTVWARTLAGMTPVVALGHVELPPKDISDVESSGNLLRRSSRNCMHRVLV